MSQIKLTQNLSISSLKAEFYIGTILSDNKQVKINKLKTACEDGTIKSRMEEAATLYHNGEFKPVIDAMKKCLASYKVNTKKTSSPINLVVEQERIDTLDTFLTSLGGKSNKRTVYGNAASDGRAKWNLTDEEVESMRGNERLLLSTRNCMSSWRTKNVSCLSKSDANYEMLSAIRDRLLVHEARINELLKELRSMPTAKETLPDSLVSKLTGGRAAMLSKEEIKLLENLLG